MKRSIVIFVALLTQISCSNLVSSAIDGVLREFFAVNSPKIDVVYASDNKNSDSENLIGNILKNKDDTLTFKLTKHKNFNLTLKLNTSSIVVFDSVESFRKICNLIEWQTNPIKRHQHLVHIQDASLSDLERIQDGFSIDTVNFLMSGMLETFSEKEKSIELVSSFMFTPQACRKNQYKTINKFDISLRKWESSNFYPNKYRNFHQCQIKAECYLHDTMEIFSKLVNATLILNPENQTVDFNVLHKRLNYMATNDTAVGYTFMFSTIAFLIPPGELYTALEKMFLPFEIEVWFAIIATVSIGLAVIQVINFCDEKVQHFVFGRNVTNPTMNMIDIFLNGSQVQTAGRNFARFIFTMFVFWCLIIRTCYQSKMFELLQVDPRKLELQTINELFEQNFSFIASPDMKTTIEELFKNADNKVSDK